MLVEVPARRLGEHVLDLACGPGTVTRQLAATMGAKEIAADVELA